MVCTCDDGYTDTYCTDCKEGYHLENGACSADQSCLDTSCSGHGACDDTSGAGVCTCEPGYTGTFSYAGAGGCSPGYDPIWLDSVSCAGGEARLIDCAHDAWGAHDCSHDEDVCITCTL